MFRDSVISVAHLFNAVFESFCPITRPKETPMHKRALKYIAQLCKIIYTQFWAVYLFQDWVFMTVHCWGENPKGSWSLVVTDNDRNTREHHVIKAKQGDMEDVERVVMDDSEKHANWDSRVINEYERPKNASPGNNTGNDHILKNMEDTTGELVKGNKFVELAKRKKNRKTVTQILKTEKPHTDQARNASKVPKNHNYIKKITSNRAHHKDWHKKTKHMKRFWNRHNKFHKRNRKHHHKGHPERLRDKTRHKTSNSKASHNYMITKSKDKLINLKHTKETKSDGDLELPNTPASDAKRSLQAIASPLIQKIIGISRTANFVSAQNHRSLVGEVDIKMKLFGNGAKQNNIKAAVHSDSSRSSVQYEHRHGYQNPSDASLPVDVYAKLLKTVESLRGNFSRSDLAKKQEVAQRNLSDSAGPMDKNMTEDQNSVPMVLGGHSNESVHSEIQINGTASFQSTSDQNTATGSSFSERRLNGSVAAGNRFNGSDSISEEIVPESAQVDENSGDISSTPFIFYDNDSRKYVALSKAGTSENVNSFVILGEGSGSGDQNNETMCDESQDGNCADNDYGQVDLEGGEEDEENAFKKLLKDQQNKTKEPEDDFGNVQGYKPSKTELHPTKEQPRRTSQDSQFRRYGNIDGMNNMGGRNEDGELPGNNDFSKSKGIDHKVDKMTGNDVMNNNARSNDETGTGSPMAENIDNDMDDYTHKGYESGRKLPEGNRKSLNDDKTLMYNNDTQMQEANTKPPKTENRLSKSGSESTGSPNINTEINGFKFTRNKNTVTESENTEKINANTGSAKANSEDEDGSPTTGRTNTEKPRANAETGNANTKKANESNAKEKASSENTNDESPLNWGVSDSGPSDLDLEDIKSEKLKSAAWNPANETDEERKIEDDFGDVNKDGQANSRLRERYWQLQTKPNSIHNSSLDSENDITHRNSSVSEEMLKRRINEEYGRINSTATSENFDGTFPNNKTFGIKINHENQVTDDVTEFSGDEISGSGNGKKVEGYENVTLADIKDDIGGYVDKSQNLQNSSLEESSNSGDGSQAKEQAHLKLQQLQPIDDALLIMQHAKTHRARSIRIHHQSKASIETKSETKNPRNGMSQENIPVNKSQNIIPEGSTLGQGLPKGLSGPLPNIVYVDDDAPEIYEPTAKEKNTMNEKQTEKEGVKQSEQLNKGVPSLDASEVSKAAIESVGDAEQMTSNNQEAEDDGYNSSEKQLRDLEAMRTENSQRLENQNEPEDGFLRRVKEDIKEKNIGDLENLENVLKQKLSKGMSDEDSNGMLKAIMSEKMSDGYDSQRLVRRELGKTPSTKAKDHGNQSTNEPSTATKESQQEHSGILESWSLIFYGT